MAERIAVLRANGLHPDAQLTLLALPWHAEFLRDRPGPVDRVARTVGIFWVGNMINGAPHGRARHRPVIAFRTRCPVCGLPNITDRCAHHASARRQL